MMGKIIAIEDFKDEFIHRLGDMVLQYVIKKQEEGYYVDIQYSSNDCYGKPYYSALVIVREGVK